MNEYYYYEVDGVIDLSNNNTFSCSKKHKKKQNNVYEHSIEENA